MSASFAFRVVAVRKATEAPGAWTLVYAEAAERDGLGTDWGVPPAEDSEVTLGLFTFRFLSYFGDESAAAAFVDGLSKKTLRVQEEEIGTSALTKRGRVILPVRTVKPEGIPEIDPLHPDDRHTFVVEEWWSSDEGIVQEFWSAQLLEVFGALCAQKVQRKLDRAPHHLGNVRVLRRLSRWRLDDAHDLATGSRWFRAVHEGPVPSKTGLLLTARLSSSDSIVSAMTLKLSDEGIRIPSDQAYDAFEVLLHDAESGALLAAESSGVIAGGWSVTERSDYSTKFTDDKGAEVQITWREPTPRSFDSAGEKTPWWPRRARAIRRLRQVDDGSLELFETDERARALKLLRDLIAPYSAQRVLIWDPYFDAGLVQSFLQALHPLSSVRILCGQLPPKVSPKQDPLANCGVIQGLQQALAAFRGSTDREAARSQLTRSSRTGTPSGFDVKVEGKARVRRHPHKWEAVYHDRFLVVGERAWMIGHGFKSLGTKAGTALVELTAPDRIRWRFENEWALAPAALNADGVEEVTL